MTSQHESILKPTDAHGLILEAWAQGFTVGALIIMAGITVSDMRRGVLLHKLILVELVFGMPHNTFIFPDPPTYGWYLSVTAVFLNLSWIMHNVVAWMKNKPFLSKKVSLLYIGTVILSVPYWIVEMYANFTYFNNINNLFHSTRPYEALFRDPWWVFTTINLFWNIKRRYEFGILELIRVSPRFGILLASMTLSVAFIIVDILSVTPVLGLGLPDGLNPFWKLAFVFKCFTDTIILDDFKTALDRLKQYKLERIGSGAGISDYDRAIGANEWAQVATWRRGTEFAPWNESTGITHVDRETREHEKIGMAVPMPKPKDMHMDNIDLELNYWTAEDRGGSSRSNRSDAHSLRSAHSRSESPVSPMQAHVERDKFDNR